MSQITLRACPEAQVALELAKDTWHANPYYYRLDGRLIGCSDITSEVIESGSTLNMTNLGELFASQLPEDQAIQLACLVLQHLDPEAVLLRECLEGNLPGTAPSLRTASTEAATRLNVGAFAQPWEGETSYGLSQWIIKWLFLSEMTVYLRQSEDGEFATVGRFYRRQEALRDARQRIQVTV